MWKFVKGKFSLFFLLRMSNEEKSIHIIEFLGKNIDWFSWSEKFLSCGKLKGYQKLLVSTHTTLVVDKIPTQEEYESALEGDDDLDKKILKLGELNELAYNNFILFKTSSSVDKVAFRLVKNAKAKIFWRETAKWHVKGWQVSMFHILPHVC